MNLNMSGFTTGLFLMTRVLISVCSSQTATDLGGSVSGSQMFTTADSKVMPPDFMTNSPIASATADFQSLYPSTGSSAHSLTADTASLHWELPLSEMSIETTNIFSDIFLSSTFDDVFISAGTNDLLSISDVSAIPDTSFYDESRISQQMSEYYNSASFGFHSLLTTTEVNIQSSQNSIYTEPTLGTSADISVSDLPNHTVPSRNNFISIQTSILPSQTERENSFQLSVSSSSDYVGVSVNQDINGSFPSANSAKILPPTSMFSEHDLVSSNPQTQETTPDSYIVSEIVTLSRDDVVESPTPVFSDSFQSHLFVTETLVDIEPTLTSKETATMYINISDTLSPSMITMSIQITAEPVNQSDTTISRTLVLNPSPSSVVSVNETRIEVNISQPVTSIERVSVDISDISVIETPIMTDLSSETIVTSGDLSNQSFIRDSSGDFASKTRSFEITPTVNISIGPEMESANMTASEDYSGQSNIFSLDRSNDSVYITGNLEMISSTVMNETEMMQTVVGESDFIRNNQTTGIITATDTFMWSLSQENINNTITTTIGGNGSFIVPSLLSSSIEERSPTFLENATDLLLTTSFISDSLNNLSLAMSETFSAPEINSSSGKSLTDSISTYYSIQSLFTPKFSDLIYSEDIITSFYTIISHETQSSSSSSSPHLSLSSSSPDVVTSFIPLSPVSDTVSVDKTSSQTLSPPLIRDSDTLTLSVLQSQSSSDSLHSETEKIFSDSILSSFTSVTGEQIRIHSSQDTSTPNTYTSSSSAVNTYVPFQSYSVSTDLFSDQQNMHISSYLFNVTDILMRTSVPDSINEKTSQSNNLSVSSTLSNPIEETSNTLVDNLISTSLLTSPSTSYNLGNVFFTSSKTSTIDATIYPSIKSSMKSVTIFNSIDSLPISNSAYFTYSSDRFTNFYNVISHDIDPTSLSSVNPLEPPSHVSDQLSSQISSSSVLHYSEALSMSVLQDQSTNVLLHSEFERVLSNSILSSITSDKDKQISVKSSQTIPTTTTIWDTMISSSDLNNYAPFFTNSDTNLLSNRESIQSSSIFFSSTNTFSRILVHDSKIVTSATDISFTKTSENSSLILPPNLSTLNQISSPVVNGNITDSLLLPTYSTSTYPRDTLASSEVNSISKMLPPSTTSSAESTSIFNSIRLVSVSKSAEMTITTDGLSSFTTGTSLYNEPFLSNNVIGSFVSHTSVPDTVYVDQSSSQTIPPSVWHDSGTISPPVLHDYSLNAESSHLFANTILSSFSSDTDELISTYSSQPKSSTIINEFSSASQDMGSSYDFTPTFIHLITPTSAISEDKSPKASTNIMKTVSISMTHSMHMLSLSDQNVLSSHLPQSTSSDSITTVLSSTENNGYGLSILQGASSDISTSPVPTIHNSFSDNLEASVTQRIQTKSNLIQSIFSTSEIVEQSDGFEKSYTAGVYPDATLLSSSTKTNQFITSSPRSNKSLSTSATWSTFSIHSSQQPTAVVSSVSGFTDTVLRSDFPDPSNIPVFSLMPSFTHTTVSSYLSHIYVTNTPSSDKSKYMVSPEHLTHASSTIDSSLTTISAIVSKTQSEERSSSQILLSYSQNSFKTFSVMLTSESLSLFGIQTKTPSISNGHEEQRVSFTDHTNTNEVSHIAIKTLQSIHISHTLQNSMYTRQSDIYSHQSTELTPSNFLSNLVNSTLQTSQALIGISEVTVSVYSTASMSPSTDGSHSADLLQNVTTLVSPSSVYNTLNTFTNSFFSVTSNSLPLFTTLKETNFNPTGWTPSTIETETFMVTQEQTYQGFENISTSFDTISNSGITDLADSLSGIVNQSFFTAPLFPTSVNTTLIETIPITPPSYHLLSSENSLTIATDTVSLKLSTNDNVALSMSLQESTDLQNITSSVDYAITSKLSMSVPENETFYLSSTTENLNLSSMYFQTSTSSNVSDVLVSSLVSNFTSPPPPSSLSLELPSFLTSLNSVLFSLNVSTHETPVTSALERFTSTLHDTVFSTLEISEKTYTTLDFPSVETTQHVYPNTFPSDTPVLSTMVSSSTDSLVLPTPAYSQTDTSEFSSTDTISSNFPVLPTLTASMSTQVSIDVTSNTYSRDVFWSSYITATTKSASAVPTASATSVSEGTSFLTSISYLKESPTILKSSSHVSSVRSSSSAPTLVTSSVSPTSPTWTFSSTFSTSTFVTRDSESVTVEPSFSMVSDSVSDFMSDTSSYIRPTSCLYISDFIYSSICELHTSCAYSTLASVTNTTFNSKTINSSDANGNNSSSLFVNPSILNSSIVENTSSIGSNISDNFNGSTCTVFTSCVHFSYLVNSSICDFITPSVPMSASMTSTSPTTSVIPTTPNPTTPKEDNATTSKEAKWVKTVLKIRTNVDVSASEFKRDTEARLAHAYNEAFLRERLQNEGKFEPLKRRKRKRRYTVVGDTAVHIHEITRQGSSTSVTLVYSVESAGNVLTVDEAMATLDFLDKQEMAIILQQVVETKIESYIPREEPVTPPAKEFNLKLIIIIAGSAGGALALVWIVVCIYCKCCRGKRSEEDEPELMSIHQQDPDKASPRRFSQANPLPRQMDRKMSSYEAPFTEISAAEPEMGVEQEKLIKEDNQRRESVAQQFTIDALVGQSSAAPKPEMTSQPEPSNVPAKRPTKNSITPTSEREEQANTNFKCDLSSVGDRSQMFECSFSKDNEDVLDFLKEEKLKNKGRMRHNYSDVNAKQPTQSTILGMQNSSIPSLAVESGTAFQKVKSEPQIKSESQEMIPAEDNLQEARSRMHKLLDEAFSLISPRSSFTEREFRRPEVDVDRREAAVKPVPSSAHVNLKAPNTSSRSNLLEHEDVPEKATEMFTNPAFLDNYSDYLETWSPYRATNNVALISMPHSTETELTQVKALSKGTNRQQITNRASRRPATNLKIGPFTYPVLDETKYTLDPPTPIVLRTKEEPLSARVNSSKSNKSAEKASLGKDIGSMNGGSPSLSNRRSTPESAIEMQSLNRNRSGSVRSNRTTDTNNHLADRRNSVIVDVEKPYKAKQNVDDQTLKVKSDERRNCEAEDDINKKPIRRKSRRHARQRMTDIV